jgi:hypothetical protein
VHLKPDPNAPKTPPNRQNRCVGFRDLAENDMMQKSMSDGSPTPRHTRSSRLLPAAANTPLLDFDEHWSATKGDELDVDFAIRDKGPPRIGGKTFNEAIGYLPTPDPEQRPHSAPTCFGVEFSRVPRD